MTLEQVALLCLAGFTLLMVNVMAQNSTITTTGSRNTPVPSDNTSDLELIDVFYLLNTPSGLLIFILGLVVCGALSAAALCFTIIGLSCCLAAATYMRNDIRGYGNAEEATPLNQGQQESCLTWLSRAFRF